jgi:hypothetical protein
VKDKKLSFLVSIVGSIFFGTAAWAINGVIMAGFILSPNPGKVSSETWKNVAQALPTYCLVGAGLGFLFMIVLRLRSAAETGCFMPLLGLVIGIILGEIYGPIFHVTTALFMDSLVWRGIAAVLGLLATLIGFNLSVWTLHNFIHS